MESSAIVVRPATTNEVPQLAALGLAAWRKGLAPLVPAAVAARLVADNPFLPFLQATGPRFLVAEIDGAAAGLGASEGDDDTISDIWVAPEFEGHGAGTALVKALEAEIAARGFTAAKIEVAAGNARALGLYEHLGYRQEWRATSFDPILQIDLEKIGLVKGLA